MDGNERLKKLMGAQSALARVLTLGKYRTRSAVSLWWDKQGMSTGSGWYAHTMVHTDLHELGCKPDRVAEVGGGMGNGGNERGKRAWPTTPPSIKGCNR